MAAIEQFDPDVSFEEYLHSPKNKLGNQRVFVAPGAQEACRVRVPRQFARGWVVTVGAPGRFNMTADLGFTGEGASDDINRSFVRILWGAGGEQHRIEVDYRQGMVIPVWGDFVQVILVVPVQPAFPPGSSQLVLGASISPGERGPATGYSGVTRTVFYNDLVFGTFQVRPIPRNARTANVILRRVAAGDTFTLTWARLDGATLLQNFFFVGGVLEACCILWVPPDATWARIDNTNAANPLTNIEIIYGLQT